MRAEVGLVPCALALLLGCAVNIANESGPPPAQGTVPALTGCLPFADEATALNGGLSMAFVQEGRALVLASSATVDGTESSTAFENASGDCLTGSTVLAPRPIIDCSALGPAMRCHPLGSFEITSTDAILYFSADHADDLASDGVGIAHWDASSERFVADSLLWTSDRPNYGSAVARVHDDIYVFGALPARFLAADVYLVRVPYSQVAEPSAYEYWQGGGSFGTDPDGAVPIVEGGLSPSVTFDGQHQRWLMLYATPLSDRVTVRTGLNVSGPWSAPFTLGTCDLPASDPHSFCTNLTLTPSLAGAGEIAFTQGVGTFSRPTAATDQDFWTRLVRAPWPSELP